MVGNWRYCYRLTITDVDPRYLLICEALATTQDRLKRWSLLCSFARSASTERKRTSAMNWDQIEGNWKQFKGRAKQQWGKLTDDELDQLAGRRDELIGKIQERYGYQRDQ